MASDSATTEEQGFGQPEASRRWERILSQEERVSRFDRWVEFLSAVILSLATVATAWCAYQASLWDGDQADHYALASVASVRAAELSNEALQRSTIHINLFVQWASAVSQDNQALSDFLYQRFPPELQVATDAWLATQPLENPDAPSSPFAMAEYVVPENLEATEARQQSSDEYELANRANDISDRYVLLTVIFASVLFFGGISGKFQSQVIDLVMLIISAVVFVVGLGILVTFPVQ